MSGKAPRKRLEKSAQVRRLGKLAPGGAYPKLVLFSTESLRQHEELDQPIGGQVVQRSGYVEGPRILPVHRSRTRARCWSSSGLILTGPL